MPSQIEVAKRRIFTADGLDVRDFKMSPGSSRDATAEQVAEQINRAISQIEAGDFDVILDTDLD